MTVLWTAAAAASATGGTSSREWSATGVSIDTRTLRPGDLFIALTALRDGHEFVAAALEGGASAAMVSRRPEGVGEDAPLLMVSDVMDGLRALGRAGRKRGRARVIAVTGSVGKTSTKEMLRDMLGGPPRVHAAEASYNNHWGVPLTLARLPLEARFAVIEIGMNAPGEIAPLSRLARPHVALITTIGRAHLEQLGSVDAIAEEKASIVEGLEPAGVLVAPGDLDQSPILRAAAERAGVANRHVRERAPEPPSPPGRHAGAGQHRRAGPGVAHAAAFQVRRARAAFCNERAGRPSCGAGCGRRPRTRGLRPCRLGAAGRARQARDAGARSGGGERDDRTSRRRVQRQPRLMSAALDALAASEPRHGVGRVAEGRRIAILGDMLELGVEEAELHAALADHPGMTRLARVHCVGPRMRALHRVLPPERRGLWVEEAEALARRAHSMLDAGDVVLVKGSKGSRVSLVVDAIRKLGHPLADDRTGTP